MKNSGFSLPDFIVILIMAVVIFSALCGPGLVCMSQAELMKIPYSWGLIQGCMIEVSPGQWVPMRNYRVM